MDWPTRCAMVDIWGDYIIDVVKVQCRQFSDRIQTHLGGWSMRNRRAFLKQTAAMAAGTVISAGALWKRSALFEARAQTGAAAGKREVRVGGQRVKVVDIHAHATFGEVAAVVKGTPLERYGRPGTKPLGPDRIQELDQRGIDVQALDVNFFWWYGADRDLASKIVEVHDQALAKWCAAHPDRFVALSSPALQFPDLAAEQAEHAIKKLGMRGISI